jgi:hypothetical protein
MEELENSLILVVRTQGEKSLGSPRLKYKDTAKLIFEEQGVHV